MQPDPDVIDGEAEVSENVGGVNRVGELLDRAAIEETAARTKGPAWIDPNGGPDEPDPEFDGPDDPNADQANWDPCVLLLALASTLALSTSPL